VNLVTTLDGPRGIGRHLFSVQPGSIHGTQILHHRHLAIEEDQAMAPRDILLRKNDLIFGVMGDSTDDDLAPGADLRPLFALIVSDHYAQHISPKY